MYVGPVSGPGAGEGVHVDLVALLQLHEDALPHHVVTLVLPVLVHDARYVQPVLTQG